MACCVCSTTIWKIRQHGGRRNTGGDRASRARGCPWKRQNTGKPRPGGPGQGVRTRKERVCVCVCVCVCERCCEKSRWGLQKASVNTKRGITAASCRQFPEFCREGAHRGWQTEAESGPGVRATSVAGGEGAGGRPGGQAALGARLRLTGDGPGAPLRQTGAGRSRRGPQTPRLGLWPPWEPGPPLLIVTVLTASSRSDSPGGQQTSAVNWRLARRAVSSPYWGHREKTRHRTCSRNKTDESWVSEPRRIQRLPEKGLW